MTTYHLSLSTHTANSQIAALSHSLSVLISLSALSVNGLPTLFIFRFLVSSATVVRSGRMLGTQR